MGIIEAATAIFAGTTGVPQYFEQKKASRRSARAQREANAVSAASAQVENARKRRQAIAQARMAQAQNQAAMGPSLQSASTVQGAQSALGAQLGANIGAQNQQITSQQQIQGLQQQSADAIRKGQERTAMWDVGAKLGSTIMSFGAGASGGPAALGNSGANAWASNTP